VVGLDRKGVLAVAETVIVIGAVGKKKEGFHDGGRPWSLWHVTSVSGVEYTTFDGGLADKAFRNVRRQALVEFDYDGHRRKLTGLTIQERSEAA
jgi:hypothetical protein